MGIKTNKQVFPFLPLNRMIKEFKRNRPPDIVFGKTMFKRRPAIP
jgi:hypothetical protein